MKHKLILILGLLLLITIFPASADETTIPTLPAQIYGSLHTSDGVPFPIGTVITAEVNGVTSTYTLTEAGKIGGAGTFDKKFLIYGATAGSTITFRISGISETITITYNPNAGGQIEPITLTFQTSSSSFSSLQGSSNWLTENPTETTPSETNPMETPIKQPTETSSPLSILGIFAGLATVAVLRRK